MILLLIVLFVIKVFEKYHPRFQYTTHAFQIIGHFINKTHVIRIFYFSTFYSHAIISWAVQRAYSNVLDFAPDHTTSYPKIDLEPQGHLKIDIEP